MTRRTIPMRPSTSSGSGEDTTTVRPRAAPPAFAGGGRPSKALPEANPRQQASEPVRAARGQADCQGQPAGASCSNSGVCDGAGNCLTGHCCGCMCLFPNSPSCYETTGRAEWQACAVLKPEASACQGVQANGQLLCVLIPLPLTHPANDCNPGGTAWGDPPGPFPGPTCQY
jgi:hypothetical protein